MRVKINLLITSLNLIKLLSKWITQIEWDKLGRVNGIWEGGKGIPNSLKWLKCAVKSYPRGRLVDVLYLI